MLSLTLQLLFSCVLLASLSSPPSLRGWDPGSVLGVYPPSIHGEVPLGFTECSGGVFCLLGGAGEAAAAGKPHPGGLRQREDR